MGLDANAKTTDSADSVPSSVRAMTPSQHHILRHALGLDRQATAYRNSFVTGPGSVDHPDCLALVAMGHMTRRDGSTLAFGGDDLFHVTEQGKVAAAEQVPA